MTRRWPALPFLLLYTSLALALFVLMRDHAFHPTDDGFVLAYSWRIVQGEVPYRDFISERMPLTPYLHSAWLALPDGWQIQAGRLAYYLELAAAAFLPTAWAVGRGLRASLPALALAAGAYLISLHNFPPMPWPTVDGIFLASAGIAAFLSWHDGRSWRWLAAAVTLITLSLLAKQTFAPLLVLAVGYAAYVAARRRHARVLVAAALPPAVIAAALALALAAAGALDEFVYQIAQPTQMRPTAENPWTGDFFTVAVAPYLQTLLFSPAVAVVLALIAVVLLLRDRVPPLARLAWPLVMLLLLASALALPLDLYGSGIAIFFGVAAIAATEVIRARRSGRPTSVPLLAYVLVLTMAWCASLSFAYQTPLLAIGALAPLVAMTVSRVPTRSDGLVAAAAVSLIAFVIVYMNLELPYRDTPRETQTADLGAIYPRFGHLYTNAFNAERHRELRDLSQRFAIDQHRGFVVLTQFPLAHFLSGTRDPLSLDWLEPQEYVGEEDRLKRELEASQPVLLVQRDREAISADIVPMRSCAEAVARAPRFAAASLARDRLVMETTHFCVYVP